jgi:hypothetical protein
MSYFNHAFKKTWLATGVETAANQRTTQLNAQEIGAFDSDNGSIATGAMGTDGKPLYLAMGAYVSSDTLGNGLTPHGGYKETLKSKMINPRYISGLGYMFNQTATNATYSYVAGHNCFPCGEIGKIRVDLKGSPALRFMAHNMYKIFSADGKCCSTGESYQDPTWVLAAIADQILADDYWKQFITPTLFTTTTGQATPSTSITPGGTDNTFIGQLIADNGGDGSLSTITDQNGGRIVLTAAYSDTTFGNCSFDTRDFAGTNVLPIQITSVAIIDDSGDVCTDCGVKDPVGGNSVVGAMGNGHGEEVLRKIILNESYRQHHFNQGAKNSSRMRDIEQGDELVAAVDRASTLYNSYYITHHVPRFNNPTGVFDNDQYVIELIGLGAAEAVGGGGTGSALINTLMGEIDAWQTGVNGANAVQYQNLQLFQSSL